MHGKKKHKARQLTLDAFFKKRSDNYSENKPTATPIFQHVNPILIHVL
jgi:hypothetical protein